MEILRLDQDEREFAKTCPLPFAKATGKLETLVFDDSDNKIQQAATIENFALTVLGKDQIQCSLEAGLGPCRLSMVPMYPGGPGQQYSCLSVNRNSDS